MNCLDVECKKENVKTVGIGVTGGSVVSALQTENKDYDFGSVEKVYLNSDTAVEQVVLTDALISETDMMISVVDFSSHFDTRIASMLSETAVNQGVRIPLTIALVESLDEISAEIIDGFKNENASIIFVERYSIQSGSWIERAGEVITTIIDLCLQEGFIGVDLADIRATLNGRSSIAVAIGKSSDPKNAAKEAALNALSAPQFAKVSRSETVGMLINFTAGPDISLFDISVAHDKINEYFDDASDVNIIFGATIDDKAGTDVKITIIAVE